MIVECQLQVVPQHQLRPIYSCSKPVKQIKSKLIKKKKKRKNTNLYNHTQSTAWTLSPLQVQGNTKLD